MKRLIFSLCLISYLNIFAQETTSLQVNGGLVYPSSADRGYSGLLQFNYPLNDKFQFYAYSGYTVWDRNEVVYRHDLTPPQTKQYLTTYTEDEHSMIPIFFGSTYNVHKNDFMTTFINLELGYSYFTYNSYETVKSENPYTGEVTGYYPDGSTKEENSENLMGIGVGAGFSHPMTASANILLAVRLNSYTNFDDISLFRTDATYTTVSVGINFDI